MNQSDIQNSTETPNTINIYLAWHVENSMNPRSVHNEDGLPISVMKIICEAAGFVCNFLDENTWESVDIRISRRNLYNYDDYIFLEETTYPYAVDALTYGMLKPNYTRKLPQFTKTFLMKMLITILTCTIFILLTNYFIFRRRFPIWLPFFYSLGAFFGHYQEWKPTSVARRILAIFWNCGIMLIYVSYSSAILSILIVPVREENLKSSNDIRSALLNGTVQLTDFEFSRNDRDMQEFPDEKLRFLGEELEFSWKIPEGIRPFEILKDNHTLVMINYRSSLEVDLNEDFFISPENMIPVWKILTVLPMCRCKNKIDGIIHRMWATGLYKRVFDDFIMKEGYLRWKTKIESMANMYRGVDVLKLSDLSEAFYILLFGYFLGFICLILERYSLELSS